MLKDCCKVEANLAATESPRPDLTIKTCGVCGCRHFEMTAEKGVIGIKGVTL